MLWVSSAWLHLSFPLFPASILQSEVVHSSPVYPLSFSPIQTMCNIFFSPFVLLCKGKKGGNGKE